MSRPKGQVLSAKGESLSVGDRVMWPNGWDYRWNCPKGYHRGEIVAFNEGVGKKCLKIHEDNGSFYYPAPSKVHHEP